MSLALILKNRNIDELVSTLNNARPKLDIQIWPDINNYDSVEFVVVWYHPDHELKKFPNLKGISSYGAGVDHILNDPGLPDVPFARIVADSLIAEMNEYVLTALLNHKRRFRDFYMNQQKSEWKNIKAGQGITVGIMGLGQLGIALAQFLNDLGFKVSGWSQSKKNIKQIETYTTDKSAKFLKDLDYLICLLPLTKSTENILNADLFMQCKNSSYLINVARGNHLNETDLIEAIQTGQISGACLDVFREEPLPKNHPFWQEKAITITPHIAAVTNVDDAVEQILINYDLALANKPLINQVDRKKGY